MPRHVRLNFTSITRARWLTPAPWHAVAAFEHPVSKRLCVIVDAEKYSGDLSVLKAMTGGDSLRYEEKHKQGGRPFRYGGMVLIAANLDIGSSDYSSGLARRRITVRFERVVDAKDRRDLEAEFRPYLAGIVNWALSLDDDRMHALLVDTDKHIRAVAASRLLMMTNTNPLAAWVDDRLAYDPKSRTYIGIKKLDANKRIERKDSWLYANYCDWCEATNHKPLSLNAFVQNLKDLLCYQLKLPGARHESQNTGKSFTAVRIRREGDGMELSPLRQYARASPHLPKPLLERW